MIGVYCPTYGRPHALQPFADNVHEVTRAEHRIVFVVEADDDASIEAARATGETVIVNPYEASYSNAIQAAYEHDDADWFVYANDDFWFRHGWESVVPRAASYNHVLGLHDGSPGCAFSTIALIRRRYIEERSGVIDIPGRVLYPYRHNYADTEFHATAVARGVFLAAPDCVVEHRHPTFGHGDDDATYARGRSGLAEDAATFAARRHLWEEIAA
ncbi:MAG TPA: glycosyltransferase [Cellulomonadaceae bacterium]|nr:glycosyltransferase [Cellulomonadaceae bacterium]